MNWSNYGKWRHPEQWNKLNNMDKITEQLIRIETKLEMLLMMVKAREARKEKEQDESREILSYEEWHKRRDIMAMEQDRKNQTPERADEYIDRHIVEAMVQLVKEGYKPDENK